MQTTDRGPLHVVHSKPAASAAEVQRAPIESLMLNLGKLGVRVVAVVAPTSVQEVRPMSRALCASFAAADIKTALIDLDPTGAAEDADPGWNPGLKLSAMHTQRDPAGYDLVVSRPTQQTRPLFNNLQHFRRALMEDLGAYKAVIINLSPIFDAGSTAPNPIAAARAADAVIVVCGTGRTDASDATKAVNDLTAAGCKVIGTILDNTDAAQVGPEMAEALERLTFLPPRMKQVLGSALRNSKLLNG